MNARIQTAPVLLGELLANIWDQELERNALGAAMLGWPMPDWLEPQHFFPTQHQRIFEAIRSVGGHVMKVNVWLRESASKYGPPVASAAELSKMCDEWCFAQRMGWEIDWDALRELANLRGLVTTMQRTTVEIRNGVISHSEARKRLSAHFQETGAGNRR